MTEAGHDDIVTKTASTGRTACPFFLAHSPHEIHCEAYEEECRCVMRFRCSESKAWHKDTYCDGAYKMCEHYIGLMEYKYGDEPF